MKIADSRADKSTLHTFPSEISRERQNHQTWDFSSFPLKKYSCRKFANGLSHNPKASSHISSLFSLLLQEAQVLYLFSLPTYLLS